jgi:tyrosine-protein kinase Etk/Wzc
MYNSSTDFNDKEEALDQKKNLKRFFFRVVSYIPLIILAFLLGIAGAKILLRYTKPVYTIKTRVIVNDDSQRKSSNLQEIIQLDTRNLSSETEREMEILRSRDLINILVAKLQLNVQYGEKGYITSGQSFGNLPITLEIEQPDSVMSTVTSEVKIVNNKILFEKLYYPVDSFVESKWGKIRWHINKNYQTLISKNPNFITIQPLADAVNRVKGALVIDPISKLSSILQLSYMDEIPERGLTILEALISLYGTTSVNYKSRISENTMKFLDGRLRIVSEDLGVVEKKLQNFKTTEGIVDPGAEGTLFLTQIKEADIKMGELDVKMDVLQQIEKYVNRRNETNSPIPATLGTTDPVITGLLNQLYQSEFELEKVKQISGVKNPEIEVFKDQIAKLKPSIIASINNLKVDITASRQQLQLQNSKLTNTLSKLPLKERLLIDISREQGVKNAIYTFLLQKREEAAIAAAAILPNYRVIEKPESAGIISPVPIKIYSIGVFLALLLAVVIIYFKEFFNNRLLFRDQIESRVSIPIIAEISFQPHLLGSPIMVGLDHRSLIGEQFRELRTNLNYVTAVTKEKCKVILITSSITGEGKSFVSINTAVSLSLTGSKVVLLEFDLRRPKISQELGIAREPGLSNYLINMATENEILKSHPTIANFNVIPSGPIPPNPAELISSPQLAELMDYLKQQFDYIIIDSPPVGAVTDAKILAAVAHSTLYIVRHNYTDSSLLDLISDIQQRNILPNLNIVFNGIVTKKILGYSYGKGYGYGYGSNYYSEQTEKKSFFKRS